MVLCYTAGVLLPTGTMQHLLTRTPFCFLNLLPTAHVTPAHLEILFDKLIPYKLSPPELLMIANVRPESYAHLTALIADVYNRFDENQLSVSSVTSSAFSAYLIRTCCSIFLYSLPSASSLSLI